MRLLFITDVHGRTARLRELPEADACLVGGDLTHFGGPEEVRGLLETLAARFPVVLGVPGNCDPAEAAGVFTQAGAGLHLARREWGGLVFWGVGGCPRTPFGTPNEWTEDTVAAGLKTLPGTDGAPLPGVLVTHAPPAGSPAALLPSGADAGSRAVAEFARRLRPVLILCGHIHEARGLHHWEGIPVVNPGPLRDGHYALIEWTPPRPPAVTLV